MIVKMSRLRLAGLKSDYDGVIDILTKSKQFEFRSAPFSVPLGEEEVENAKIEQSSTNFAIEQLYKFNDEAKERIKQNKKANVLADYKPFAKENVRKIIDFDKFIIAENKREELQAVIAELRSLSFERVRINTNLQNRTAQLKEYGLYRGFDMSFDRVSTLKTEMMLYFTTKKEPVVTVSDRTYYELHNVEGGVVISLVCLKEEADEVEGELKKLNFVDVPYKEGNISDLIASCEDEINKLKCEKEELLEKGLCYEKYLTDLMVYYDLIGIRLEQKSAYNASLTTTYTFVLDGWVPEKTGEQIVDLIEKKFDVCAVLTPATPEEEPPTLIVNNKLVAPFENITEMYTVPAYTERDPNPHMAFWYFLLFGIMCGDVVYGTMLTLACLVLLKVKKFEPSTASLIKMFALCGVSSALWGVAFDSYLGYGIGFGWFVPMEKPMMLLGLSLVAGILQITYGYLLGVARCIREHNFAGAIFDMGLMLVVIAAIVLLGANIFVGIFTEGVFDMGGQFIPTSLSELFGKIGLIMLLVAIVGIFLTAGRASKSIGGKIGNGLYGVYGLVNLVSDILSYCRLFGLGLAGGAIAYAFNTLMETVFFSGGTAVAFILGAVLSLVLHVFNLAISLLGAYVHNARLQMLEFYGKFLLGDGRDFSYMGSKTRYVRYQ